MGLAFGLVKEWLDCDPEGLRSPPVCEVIEGNELVEADNEPEGELERCLRGLVSQMFLGQKSPRPATDKIQRVEERNLSSADRGEAHRGPWC